MNHKIYILAAFDAPDDSRERARIIAALAPEIDALEEKIEALTGIKARVECEARRAKALKDTAVLPVHRVAAERI